MKILLLFSLWAWAILAAHSAPPALSPEETLSLRGLSRDVWIAVRTDGLPGSGTPGDPFDGSTFPRFDALLARLKENTVIHLLPGVFETEGGVGNNSGFGSIRSGWKIVGSGMGVTTIRLAPSSMKHAGTKDPQYFTVLASKGNTDGVEVSDLTIDCNVPSLKLSNPGDAVEGVVLNGSYCVIRRVEVINAYGSGPLESTIVGVLPLYLGAGNVIGNRIEECVVHQLAGKMVDAFSMGISTNKAGDFVHNVGGTVRGCRAEGAFLSYLYGGTDGLLSGNYADGTIGFYGDTGIIDRVILSQNTFLASLAGIKLVPSPRSRFFRIVASQNVIVLTADGATAFWLAHYSGDGVGGDSQFTGNNVSTLSGSSQILLNTEKTWSHCLFDGNVSTVSEIQLHEAPSFIVGRNLINGVWTPGSSQ